MSRTRFRIRTVMIAVAALAIVMGTTRFASVHLGIEEVSFQVKGRNVWLYVDRMVELNELPGTRGYSLTIVAKGGSSGGQGKRTVLFGSTRDALMIPITTALILTGVPFGLLAVALNWRSLCRRREILEENPVDVGVRGGCTVGGPNRNGNGGPNGA